MKTSMPQRIGPPEIMAADLTVPPWETRCRGGARLRHFCKLAGFPVNGRCGFASQCRTHPAVQDRQYKLLAEAPGDAEALGNVRDTNGRTIVLYALAAGEVVGVPEKEAPRR